MRYRPIFVKFKNFCDSQGYSISQIQNVTDAQAKTLLNMTDEEFAEYQNYVSGIKAILIRDLQAVIDTQTVADFKSQIHTWLLARFPDYEVEKDFSNPNNRKVTFYLDGYDE